MSIPLAFVLAIIVFFTSSNAGLVVRILAAVGTWFAVGMILKMLHMGQMVHLG